MPRDIYDDHFVLILSEFEARRFGISEEDIERAKTAPQPCPHDWPVPGGSRWMIQKMIPIHGRRP